MPTLPFPQFFWHVVSSFADLVNTKVMYLRGRNCYGEAAVQDRHNDGTHATIADLKTFSLPLWNGNPDGFTLMLVFEYVKNSSAV